MGLFCQKTKNRTKQNKTNKQNTNNNRKTNKIRLVSDPIVRSMSLRKKKLSPRAENKEQPLVDDNGALPRPILSIFK